MAGHRYTQTISGQRTFVYVVGPGYFRAMGIPVKSGRDFSDNDVPDAKGQAPPRPVIVNETWRASSIRASIRSETRNDGNTPLTIVGVVADVRQSSLDEAPVSQMYLAWAQGGGAGLDLIVQIPAADDFIGPDASQDIGGGGFAVDGD